MASHMVAPPILLSCCLAVGALCDEWVGRGPDVKCCVALVVASPLVPLVATAEAHQLAAFTLRSVCEKSWFLHDLAAVRKWAPLKFTILANLDILPYSLELLLNVFRAEPLNMLWPEEVLALKLHARQPEGVSILYLGLQVVPVAIHAEAMVAWEREEVFCQVLLIARVAELAFFIFFDWLNIDIKVSIGKALFQRTHQLFILVDNQLPYLTVFLVYAIVGKK